MISVTNCQYGKTLTMSEITIHKNFIVQLLEDMMLSNIFFTFSN